MALTTTNMGLKAWDLSTDFWTHSELLANWQAIDVHDHTTGKGLQIPTGGITAGAVTGPKIAPNIIDSSKILAASVTDADRASPNNQIYRPLIRNYGVVDGNEAVNTYVPVGSVLKLSGAASFSQTPDPWQLVAADLAVANKTTVLRWSIAWYTNTNAPGSTFSWDLRPIATSVGGAGLYSFTIGAAVTNSSSGNLVAPGASKMGEIHGSDFTLPADGPYILAVNVIGQTTAATSALFFAATLGVRNI